MSDEKKRGMARVSNDPTGRLPKITEEHQAMMSSMSDAMMAAAPPEVVAIAYAIVVKGVGVMGGAQVRSSLPDDDYQAAMHNLVTGAPFTVRETCRGIERLADDYNERESSN